MKSIAITDPEQIKRIDKCLEAIKGHDPASFLFFTLIYQYGFKQSDLQKMCISDLVDCDSPKYTGVEVPPELISIFSADTHISDIIPSRESLYYLFNSFAKNEGLQTPISVDCLRKTWAYNELHEGHSLADVMRKFQYGQSAYRFITEHLGLDDKTCMSCPNLAKAYVYALAHSIPLLNYSECDYSDLKFLHDHLLAIIGFFR